MEQTQKTRPFKTRDERWPRRISVPVNGWVLLLSAATLAAGVVFFWLPRLDARKEERRTLTAELSCVLAVDHAIVDQHTDLMQTQLRRADQPAAPGVPQTSEGRIRILANAKRHETQAERIRDGQLVPHQQLQKKLLSGWAWRYDVSDLRTMHENVTIDRLHEFDYYRRRLDGDVSEIRECTLYPPAGSSATGVMP